MPHEIKDLKGVAGKTLESVTVTNHSDYCCITVQFTDKTALAFRLDATTNIEPELMDWKTGDGKTIRRFPKIIEKPC